MLEGVYQSFVYPPTGAATTEAATHLGPSSSPPHPPSSPYPTSEQPGHHHSHNHNHRHHQNYYRASYDSTTSSNSTNSSSSSYGGYYMAQSPAAHHQQSTTTASAGSTYEPPSPMFPGHRNNSNNSDSNYFVSPLPNSNNNNNNPASSVRSAPAPGATSNDGGGCSWDYSPPARPVTLSSPTLAAGGGSTYVASGSSNRALSGAGGSCISNTPSIPNPHIVDYVPGSFSRHKLTTTVWEDEGTLCYQVDAKGICVARRADNQMVNGTKLLNVVGMSRGKRDGILKNERGRVVIKVGAMHLKGVWIALHRAKYLANKFRICELLYPLFEENPRNFVHPASPVITRSLLSSPSSDKQPFWSDNSSSNSVSSKRTSLPSILDQQQGASRGGHHHHHPLDTTGSVTNASTTSGATTITVPPPPSLSLPRPQPGYHSLGYHYHEQPHLRPETPADYTRHHHHPHHLFQSMKEAADPMKTNKINRSPDQQHQQIKLSYDPVVNTTPESSARPSPSGNDREKRSHGDV